MKDFELIEVRPKIFLMSFPESYDLAMYFLRYQEFYESPSDQYRGHSFEILDFMKWYSITNGNGVFTYPDDWEGFNIPGSTIKQVWDLGITDRNKYDYEMLKVYQECQEKAGDNFYLIGAPINDKNSVTLRHEIAHGFFYTTPKYYQNMSELVAELPQNLHNIMTEELYNLGYVQHVYVDEIQAYMATGLPMSPDESSSYISLEKAQEPFIKIFNQYFNNK